MIAKLINSDDEITRYKKQTNRLNKYDTPRVSTLDTAITVNNKTYSSPEQAASAIEKEALKQLENTFIKVFGKENVNFNF